MLHIFQDGQRIGNDLVGFIAFDIGHEADPTSVPFKFGAYKPLIAILIW